MVHFSIFIDLKHQRLPNLIYSLSICTFFREKFNSFFSSSKNIINSGSGIHQTQSSYTVSSSPFKSLLSTPLRKFTKKNKKRKKTL